MQENKGTASRLGVQVTLLGPKASEIVDFRGLFLVFDYCGAGGEPAYAFNMILRSNSSAISSKS